MGHRKYLIDGEGPAEEQQPAPEAPPTETTQPEPATAAVTEVAAAAVDSAQDEIRFMQEQQAAARRVLREAAEAGQTAAPVAGSASAQRTYVVQPGDSLSAIALAIYGNAYRDTDIFEANRDVLSDPNVIHPGQTLKIPD